MSGEDILAETLRWTEEELGERRRTELATLDDAPSRLVRFVEIYTPEGPGDPNWALWLEVWERSLGNGDIVAVEEELERAWLFDLADIVAYGIRRREFSPVDPDDFAERYCLLLDGYSMRLAAGHRAFTRVSVIRRLVSLAARELGFRASAVMG